LTLGQTLAFTANATDNDLPLQTLTYSLGAGAPAGATIDAMSGFFSWTPTAIQTPGTNNITVIVTDNGLPPLSSTQVFTVVTHLPPQVIGANVNGSQFTISWQTVSGQTYQVEYKDDLTAPTWLPAQAAVLGDGGRLILTNDVSASTNRFFRLRLE
ncbi:MAG TPA: putative Ig domain-containing protein, partial [Verrucomicrobiae bacterium]